MNARNQLAVHQGGASSLAALPSGWDMMVQQATMLVQSGFLPNTVNTPEKAIAIVMTGEELGIPKMLALRSINVINGKPTLSADLMVALVQRAIDQHKDGEFRVLPPTATECTVNYRRWGWSEGHSYTYTIEDAKRAGLAGKGTWAMHPAAMLRARATSAVCRMAFPDVISGLYTPEELDEEEVEGWEAAKQAQGWSAEDDGLSTRIDPEVESEPDPPENDVAPPRLSSADKKLVDSCKDKIHDLATYLSWDGKRVQAMQEELFGSAPKWNAMTLEQASMTLQNMQYAVAEFDKQQIAKAQEGILPIDARYSVDGEPGNDRFSQ